jgi:hypothetical protein
MFFPPNPKADNFKYHNLMKWYMVLGHRYYCYCIALLVVGFFNCLVREDYTVPIAVIGMIAYWLNGIYLGPPRDPKHLKGVEKTLIKQGPNYYIFEWPDYMTANAAAGAPLTHTWPTIKLYRIFYMRHCICAAELFLISIIFSIVFDVLWISVHWDYLQDYGYSLPYDTDFTIKWLVSLHKFAVGVSICQLLLKLISIYYIVSYIRVLCFIFWTLIPVRGKVVVPTSYMEPAAPPPKIPIPDEPPAPLSVPPPPIQSPSVADL